MTAHSDSGVKVLPREPVAPLFAFPEQDEFVWRHEQGTLIELHNEQEAIKRMNEKRSPLKAWPIAPIPGLTTSFTKSWLFLVKIPSAEPNVAFPTLTDRFTIDMESKIDRPEGTFSLVHMPAARVQNPYEGLENVVDSSIKKCAAFKVDVPRSWQSDDGVNIELDLMSNFQTASSISDAGNLTADYQKCQIITIKWDTCSLTFEAELAALRHLTDEHRLEELKPHKMSMKAFQMIRDFNNVPFIHSRDLFEEFPQLKNPAHFSHRIPRVLVDKFKAMNADHRAAFEGLKDIPNNLYFVNGCPGAGKTEWNMVLSAIIQSKKSPKGRRPHTPILFLVDINKTVDDAANRYHSLCKAAGLKLRIIRMHGWPYEMRNSNKLNKGGPKGQQETESELDFTKKFLTIASLSRHTTPGRNPNVAPTLDEASWEYFDRHQDGCFPGLKKLLAKMESGEVLGTEDWKCIRRQVSFLYRTVLSQTDFIATTPVASYGGFSRLFEPDVIFMDEAPHARELTTLIPIAYYSPLAWIFTGDVKQTRPFVKSTGKRDMESDGMKFNPFAEQLRVSTMARAAAVNALNSKLLVNKRAYGNLHRLPSKMFYGAEMTSGHDGASMYPPSAQHLKEYLKKLGGVPDVDENRVVVRLKESQEMMHRDSFWNPAHHEWLLQQVQDLLRDEAFHTVSGPAGAEGSIMIATPYSTAARQYNADVRKWPKEWQDRVEVLTVDKAQGNQADVVFLDMVRTIKAGFMDDAQRLNVAITRARQAEVIIMHHRMTMRYVRGDTRVKTQYLTQVWDDAVEGRRMFSL
ncbi:putative ATP-dependent helicase [Tolypocladium ophioglossoides CBS 100239]|uniref:Putative ATP-dependent helicase n=1 Tax=Tolypocladium ophioglossoides (strain CBS 100239) TaxID=1163406 RepID=A0A0L0MZQ5_TOLOC|nr:putative ATP-dependent helicase [Tolypocladium ophioglossoides CBS 100239]